MSNRLRDTTSPYLLQHAENPVDWYPWGPEALRRAKAEDKPIFLSIGYAACHWCHVMAHESFENPETAALLNRDFVSIKVDREERPDLDSVYMEAVVALTGQGGWPMSVFLTSDGRPFYGGTYFPPTARHNLPAFPEVLRGIAQAWRENRQALLDSASRVAAHIAPAPKAGATSGGLDAPVLDRAAEGLLRAYDWANGGWGAAPKFPQPLAVEVLLRRHARGRDRLALDMAAHALTQMAGGGVADQLGGGFHRYTVDAGWRVPHFEKMLYDNALLARAYLHAWQATGETLFLDVAERTLGFALRELRDPSGGFYASLDADSEGAEGKYYVWAADEFRRSLGDPELAELAAAAFGVTQPGEFDGANVLRRAAQDGELAARFGLPAEEVGRRLESARALLLERRQARPRPACDDKVLTEWNGLLLTALAEAGRALGRAEYLSAAQELAAFLLQSMVSEGRLRRTWRRGQPGVRACLADHAALGEGMLALYQADFDQRWFEAAVAQAETILTRFPDPSGGFFDVPDDHEALLTRPKVVQDSPTPSGSALAVTLLLHLAALTGEARFAAPAEAALAGVQDAAGRYPTAFAGWLCALDLALGPQWQLAIVGPPDDQAFRRLADIAARPFLPRLVVAGGPPEAAPAVALLRDRQMIDGRPAAYLCQGFVCRLPTSDPETLQRQMTEAA